MRETKTVHINATLEVTLPFGANINDINLGLDGSVIMNHWEIIVDAKIHTWWVDRVTACNSIYVTCPQCNKVELSSNGAVILDGKPLCILCSAEYEHGDLPTKRTSEQIESQLKGIGFRGVEPAVSMQPVDTSAAAKPIDEQVRTAAKSEITACEQAQRSEGQPLPPGASTEQEGEGTQWYYDTRKVAEALSLSPDSADSSPEGSAAKPKED